MYSMWTRSYIKVNGRKIYLEDYYSDVKKKMNDNKKEIEVKASGLVFGKTVTYQKSAITEYGKVG